MIKKYAVINAALTALYIVLISSFVFYVPKALHLNDKPDNVFAPIIMLSLLVFSAALVGFLIFGRPIMWYLDGKKQEALKLLVSTLVTFFIIILGLFLTLYLVTIY